MPLNLSILFEFNMNDRSLSTRFYNIFDGMVICYLLKVIVLIIVLFSIISNCILLILSYLSAMHGLISIERLHGIFVL